MPVKMAFICLATHERRSCLLGCDPSLIIVIITFTLTAHTTNPVLSSVNLAPPPPLTWTLMWVYAPRDTTLADGWAGGGP